VFTIKVARPLKGIEEIKGIKGIKGVKGIKRIEGIEALLCTSITIRPLGLEVTIFTRNLLRKFTSRAYYAFNYLFRSCKLERYDNLLVRL
jgi:hypothetical protein